MVKRDDMRSSFALRPVRAAFIIASFLSVSFLSLAGGCGGGHTTGTDLPGTSRSNGALFDGCGGEGTQVAQPNWTVQCGCPIQPKRKWTVLLYMNGANDLEEFGTLNLNQLEQVGSDANVTFVAQFKRAHLSDKDDDDTSDGDWVGTRRIVVHKDSNSSHVSSPIVSSQADVDMGDPATLKEFVQWGIQTYPAEHYAIVLWNHGAGWRSRAAQLPTRGFSYDDEKGTHVDTIELPAAIDIGSGQKWDLVAWDSSLMQMLEVGYEIRSQTDWIVGSEESPPGSGYPYHVWAKALADKPDSNAQTIGRAICDSMYDAYGSGNKVTQSLIRTDKLAAVVGAVNDLGEKLLAAKSSYGSQIAEARDFSEYYYYRENKDLLDFTQLIQTGVPDTAVKNAAAQVESALQATIVFNIHRNDHPNSNGLAIYLPTPNGYKNDDVKQANGFGQRYGELRFAKDAPNWQSFLVNGPP